MSPAEPTSPAAEEARQARLTAARDRLRRHLYAEAGAADGEGVRTAATAEVQAFLDRLRDGRRPP